MNVSGSFLWISLLLGVVYSDQRPRIWNGSPAEKNQFPYHVMIKTSDHFCGGAIFNDHWVLTAAHCFNRFNMKPGYHYSVPFRGQFGGNSPFRPKDYDIVFNTLIIHKHFRDISGIPVNDIALLRASEPIISKDLVVKSIQIPEQNEEFRSGRVVLTGGGRYEENNFGSDHLRFVELQLFTDEDCLKSIKRSDRSLWFTPEAMICAGGDPDDPRVVDACGGDSGGPLVYQRPDGTKVVVGIVSNGITCSDHRSAHYPGVYTKVALFSDWIKYHTSVQREPDNVEYPNCKPRPTTSMTASTPSSGSFAAIQTSVHMRLIISTMILLCV